MLDYSMLLHRWHGTLELIRWALAEDQAMFDQTSSLLPAQLCGHAVLKANEPGIVAGVEVALEVFRQLDPSLTAEALVSDGDGVRPGQALGSVQGPLASIFRAERSALNFFQRMSGIATGTRALVHAVADLPSTIVDTRKTLPGWRLLDKHAVRVGGGHNHRMTLADGVLIKDNHIAAMTLLGVDVAELVRRARSQAPHTLRIEVEVQTEEQARDALGAGADILMLDNMDLESMRRVVAVCRGRALTEASGGITLETVREVAETGVDLISCGAITHSARALDINLEAG